MFMNLLELEFQEKKLIYLSINLLKVSTLYKKYDNVIIDIDSFKNR